MLKPARKSKQLKQNEQIKPQLPLAQGKSRRKPGAKALPPPKCGKYGGAAKYSEAEVLVFLEAAEEYRTEKGGGRGCLGVGFVDLNRRILHDGAWGKYGLLWPRVATDDSKALRKLCTRLIELGRFA